MKLTKLKNYFEKVIELLGFDRLDFLDLLFIITCLIILILIIVIVDTILLDVLDNSTTSYLVRKIIIGLITSISSVIIGILIGKWCY